MTTYISRVRFALKQFTTVNLLIYTFALSFLRPGEYITLYQTQRNALKSYYKDRERMIAQLSSEKANMQVSQCVKI